MGRRYAIEHQIYYYFFPVGSLKKCLFYGDARGILRVRICPNIYQASHFFLGGKEKLSRFKSKILNDHLSMICSFYKKSKPGVYERYDTV